MPTKPEATVEPAAAAETTVARADASQAPPLIDVEDLQVHFALSGGFFSRMFGHQDGSVKAVDGVSFTLRPGEVLGLVGESGSGKTTLGRALLHLVAPTGGSVKLGGQEISALSEREFRPLRKRMQMVFQDPHAALNPSMDIGTAVGHPLKIHGLVADREELDAKVRAAFDRVGLSPPDRFLTKYPSDLSGGQKQRAVIARAIILGPEVLVADEPVSMLDMSVRSKILELMIELKNDLGLTYLYITHDLASAKFFCDRIAIMYLGRIVEIGPAEQIYADPKHPYTRSLLRAIPEPDPRKAVPRDLPRGEVPDAVAPPLGCSFHPRCPLAFDKCGWESRDLRQLLEERWIRLGDEVFEAERSTIGDLDALDTPSTTAVLPAGSGHSGTDVAELIARVRQDTEDDPFWTGVREMETQAQGVRFRFNDGVDPGLNPIDEVGVACLLHGEAVAGR
ncbi:MAG: ABC transporter ATP-binding protein [Sciscionella sp.]